MRYLRFSVALVLILCTLLLASCSGGGKWYLEHETDHKLASPDVPASLRGYSVHLPLTQTQRAEKFEITAEFFEEKYALGGVMQARFTVKNTSDVNLYFYGKTGERQGSVYRDDGKVFEYRILDKDEVAANANDELSFICLKPGESRAWERAYVVDPEFFTTGHTYTLVFEAEGHEDSGRSEKFETCELKVDICVAK